MNASTCQEIDEGVDVAAMIVYLLFGLAATAVGWLCLTMGLWIYSLLGKFEIEVIDGEVVVESTPPPIMDVLAHSETPPPFGQEQSDRML